jgi:hypothetical protein
MRIFISYSHKDRDLVNRIAAGLKADGHDIWMDTLRLKPGDKYLQRGLNGVAVLRCAASRIQAHCATAPTPGD